MTHPANLTLLPPVPYEGKWIERRFHAVAEDYVFSIVLGVYPQTTDAVEFDTLSLEKSGEKAISQALQFFLMRDEGFFAALSDFMVPKDASPITHLEHRIIRRLRMLDPLLHELAVISIGEIQKPRHDLLQRRPRVARCQAWLLTPPPPRAKRQK